MPELRCKGYHDDLGPDDPGEMRSPGTWKSRCPGWAADERLRLRLLADALVDPEAGDDSCGNPRILWNAVQGWYFIGRSTNEQVGAYDCYPEAPATSLHAELSRRAERTVADLLAQQARP